MIAKKMISEIESVRVIMLDKFSGVDQRLTTIEHLLYKIIETQNKVVNVPEKGMEVVVGEGECGPLRESRDEIPWDGDNSYGWVGLYSNCESDFRKKNESSFGRFLNEMVCDGKKFIKERVDNTVSMGETVIKASEDEVFNDSLKSNHCGTTESLGKTDVLLRDSSKSDKSGKKDSVQNDVTGKCGGFVESDQGRDCKKLVEEQTDSEDGRGPKRKHPVVSPVVKASQEEFSNDSLKSDQMEINKSYAGSSGSLDKLAYKTDGDGDEDKTDVSLQDSTKPDECGKKDSGSCGNSLQNEVTDECERGHDWSNFVEEKTDVKEGWGSWGNNGDNKRKRYNSPVGGPNDGPSSSGPFTETRRRLDKFTPDEQDILNDIEPIMQSVRRILNPNEYNDGDPLSPDDQTFILNNILSHHPNKVEKMGAGVDYIMIRKHTKHQMSRCFHIVSTDGRKEEFSYKKCVENYLRGKYPDKASKFIPKYFKPNQPQPQHRFPGNGDYSPYGARTHYFRPGYNSGARRPPGVLHQPRVGVNGPRQGLKTPWRQMIPRWGS